MKLARKNIRLAIVGIETKLGIENEVVPELLLLLAADEELRLYECELRRLRRLLAWVSEGRSLRIAA